MLDQEGIKIFLENELKKMNIEVPKSISIDNLAQAFCHYVEEDYNEWLKDNFETFFDNGKPDWKWIKKIIKTYKTKK